MNLKNPAALPLSERSRIHLVNPSAAGGRHLAAVEKAVSQSGGTLLKSEYPGHLTELIREAAAKDPYAHFIVYGGDGTVFEAVNALMASGCSDTVSFSVIPAGSGNDFSAHANDSGELEKYALTPIDVVRTTAGGTTRYFANMMNIGFDCSVVSRTYFLKEKTFFRGSAAYIAGAAMELVRKKPVDAVVTLSDCCDPETGEALPDRSFRQKILLTAAGNGSFCGGGFHALPLASLTDGKLDVLVVNDVSRLRFVLLVGDYRAGTYLDESSRLKDRFRGVLELIRCGRMKVEGPEAFCLDGEVFLTGDDRLVEAEVVPGALLYAAL